MYLQYETEVVCPDCEELFKFSDTIHDFSEKENCFVGPVTCNNTECEREFYIKVKIEIKSLKDEVRKIK